jgi:hypothetical protein
MKSFSTSIARAIVEVSNTAQAAELNRFQIHAVNNDWIFTCGC